MMAAPIGFLDNGFQSFKNAYVPLNFTFNVLQAGATYLQRTNFSCARHYSLINNFILIIESTFLIVGGISLCKKIVKQWAPHDKSFPVKMTAALLSVMGLSILIVKVINFLNRPSIDLQEIFNRTISLSAENTPVINVSFQTPIFHSINMWITVNSLFLKFFTAFFSSRPYLEVGNAALKTISLFNLSRLRWLTFEREDLNFPFMNIPISGQAGYLVEKVNTSFHFLIPSHSVHDISYLQSVIQSVYEYTHRFFHHSVWDFHISVQAVNQQVSTTIYFSAQCKAAGIELVKGVQPVLVHITAKVFALIKRTFVHTPRWYDLRLSY